MTIVYTKGKVYVASESTGFDYQIYFKEIKPNYIMEIVHNNHKLVQIFLPFNGLQNQNANNKTWIRKKVCLALQLISC